MKEKVQLMFLSDCNLKISFVHFDSTILLTSVATHEITCNFG